MILISAFEPFGGQTINTSAEVQRMLPDRIGSHDVKKILLPVEYGSAAEHVLKNEGDFIFLLGEAGSRQSVTPEMKATNMRKAIIADNAGRKFDGEKIEENGVDTYETQIPVEKIVEQMQSEGYEILISHDAGTYVCNDTFYLVGVHSSSPVEFIHVPHVVEKIAELAVIVKRFISLVVGGGVESYGTVET